MSSNRPLLFAILLFDALLVAGALWWFFLRTPARGLPNVLVVTCDTLRADRLHLYGHGRPTSPNLDAMAADSVVFDRFFSNASFTPPSHGSILTGYYPNAHGVLWWDDVLREGAPTIGEIIGTPPGEKGKTGFGFETAAFVNLENFQLLGLTRGFAHVRSQIWFPGDDLNRDFFEWLDGRSESGAPFCVWLHYWDPHRPYAYRSWEFLKPNPEKSPAELAAASPREQATYRKLLLTSARAPFEFHETTFGRGDPWVGRSEGHYNRRKGEREGAVPVAPGVKRMLTDADDAYLVDRYDGGVRFLDECLGALVQGLRERRLLDETILVLTSDHGETFKERDDRWFTHDPHLYDEVTRVPCVIRFPDGAHGGRRVESLAESVDLVPTILDHLGLPWKHLNGRSLLPVVEGTAPPSRGVFSQTQDKRPSDKDPNVMILTDRKYSVRTERHRLVVHGSGNPDFEAVELYDLVADPGATVNLYPRERAAAAPLLERLRAWIAATPPVPESKRHLTDSERAMLPGYVR